MTTDHVHFLSDTSPCSAGISKLELFATNHSSMKAYRKFNTQLQYK